MRASARLFHPFDVISLFPMNHRIRERERIKERLGVEKEVLGVVDTRRTAIDTESGEER